MDQLINSLPALLHAAGDSEEIREMAAMVAWNHVAGEGLRRQTEPIGLRQHRMIVAVPDAIWMRQLALMSSQLLFRLNSLLGRGVVTFIEFRIDPGAIQSAKDSRQTEQDEPRKPERELPIPFELVSAASAIHDSRLRRAFLGAAMSCARRMERGEG